MTASDGQNLSAYCRVCLQVPEERQVLDVQLIYDEEEQLSYYDCFSICTQIDLNAGDHTVPHNLCKSCGLELQMAYDFYKKVEHSKNVLKQLNDNCAEQASEQTSYVKHEKTLDDAVTEAETETACIDIDVADAYEELEEIVEQTIEQVQVEESVEDDDVGVDLEEEHLEMDEFQAVGSSDDDDAETIQIKLDSKCNTVDGDDDVDDNISIMQIVDDIANDDVDYDDTFETMTPNDVEMLESEHLDCSESENSQQSWQQAVGTVANETHLPLLQSENKNKSKAKTKTTQPQSDSPNAAPTTVNERKRRTGPFVCHYCEKVFPNYSRMAMHRRSHDPDRPKYPCPNCERCYATKQAMDVHVRTVHTKTAGYICPLCKKIYAIRKCLEVHMRYHTGDFPFVCDLCGKKFAQISHLNTHKLVKHNSVRFSCEHPNCGKFFTSSASLRNHEFSHSEMPFECEFCQRGYPAKAKLRVHIRRKHGQDMTIDELEHMRKFHVMRSKLSLVKLVKCED